jgi:redox-sensitive bicupin YhaK (pirin superfamily)
MTDERHEPTANLYAGAAAAVADPDTVLLPGHDVPLGRYTTVRRLLPQRPRRMVGAWCFVDQFGPDDVAGRPGMQVPPHPHTGLQTVTWLAQGAILHRDSLGNRQLIEPGQLNLMSSGRGIAHSEESPPDHPPVMHGLQLWVALPDAARHQAPRFDHHPAMPRVRVADCTATVVVGEFGGVRSPAAVHTPLLGADLVVPAGGGTRLPLDPAYEHAVLTMAGAADIAGVRVEPGALLYLGLGRDSIDVSAQRPARLFLLGGEPFDEPLVMWWNFVGRSHDEVADFRADWAAQRRFGIVEGYAGERLPAPEMPTVRLKARDRHGRTLPG